MERAPRPEEDDEEEDDPVQGRGPQTAGGMTTLAAPTAPPQRPPTLPPIGEAVPQIRERVPPEQSGRPASSVREGRSALEFDTPDIFRPPGAGSERLTPHRSFYAPTWTGEPRPSPSPTSRYPPIAPLLPEQPPAQGYLPYTNEAGRAFPPALPPLNTDPNRDVGGRGSFSTPYSSLSGTSTPIQPSHTRPSTFAPDPQTPHSETGRVPCQPGSQAGSASRSPNVNDTPETAPEGRGRRRRGNLPKPTTEILKRWFEEHSEHPYPTEEQKTELMNQTNLAMSQISNWFINQRRRGPQRQNRRQQTNNPRGRGSYERDRNEDDEMQE